MRTIVTEFYQLRRHCTENEFNADLLFLAEAKLLRAN